MIKLNNIEIEQNDANVISNLNRDDNVKNKNKMFIDQNVKNIKKSSNKCGRIKDVFFEWSENCDLNCYRKVFDKKSNYFVRFIWLVILLASTCGTFVLIGYSVLSYFEYKVVTEIKIIHERPTEFPAITFCDNNPLTTREAQLYEEKMSNLLGDDGELFYIRDLFLLFHASNISFGDENRKKLGFNLNENLEFCQYLENKTDCKPDLHWYWSFRYGNCWQFNSGLNFYNQKTDIKRVSLYGKDYGLDIKFNVFNNNNKKINYEAGVIIFVHNSSYKPTSSDIIHIEPGKKYYISVKRIFIEKYPVPYSDCINFDQFESPFYDLLIKTNKFYRQKDCFELCSQEQIMRQCKCYNLEYLNIGGILNMSSIEPCFNITQFKCMKKSVYNFIKEECVKIACPLECNSVEFEVSYSTLAAPSLDFYKYSGIEKNLSYEEYKSSNVWLNIFYTNLEYTIMTESPKIEKYDLFTQIGGALGMFVSFSIFTIFELIEILFLILHSILLK